MHDKSIDALDSLSTELLRRTLNTASIPSVSNPCAVLTAELCSSSPTPALTVYTSGILSRGVLPVLRMQSKHLA